MTFVRLALLTALAILLALTLSAFLARWTQPFELISNFRLHLALGCGALALALAFTRQRRAALAAALALTLNAATIAYPLALSAQQARAETGGVRVVWANLEKKNENLQRLAAWARAQNADIVALTELPTPHLQSVQRALPGFSCFVTDASSESQGATLIASRAPCTASGSEGVPDRPHAVQWADIGGMRIAAIHPSPPWNNERLARRNGIIAAGARALNDHAHAILVGDFNATPWSPAMVDLGRGPLRRILCGGLLTATWRSNSFPHQTLPIDHVFVTEGVAVSDCQIGPPFGSDHRPLVFTARRR